MGGSIHSHARGAIANLLDHTVVHHGSAFCQGCHQPQITTCCSKGVDSSSPPKRLPIALYAHDVGGLASASLTFSNTCVALGRACVQKMQLGMKSLQTLKRCPAKLIAGSNKASHIIAATDAMLAAFDSNDPIGQVKGMARDIVFPQSCGSCGHLLQPAASWRTTARRSNPYSVT